MSGQRPSGVMDQPHRDRDGERGHAYRAAARCRHRPARAECPPQPRASACPRARPGPGPAGLGWACPGAGAGHGRSAWLAGAVPAAGAAGSAAAPGWPAREGARVGPPIPHCAAAALAAGPAPRPAQRGRVVAGRCQGDGQGDGPADERPAARTLTVTTVARAGRRRAQAIRAGRRDNATDAAAMSSAAIEVMQGGDQRALRGGWGIRVPDWSLHDALSALLCQHRYVNYE